MSGTGPRAARAQLTPVLAENEHPFQNQLHRGFSQHLRLAFSLPVPAKRI